ncbi:MAG: hypothetical protein HKN11_10335 [Rhizobiales bacterium]|nr:hypothetical protein [Hyphomicrobiales bacterium]
MTGATVRKTAAGQPMPVRAENEPCDSGLDDLVGRAIAGLLPAASDPERCLAAQLLAHVSWSAGTPLVAGLLRDPDPDVRIDAVRTVKRTRDPSLAALLIENLQQDPVGEAKVEYIEALQALGAREALPLLLELVAGRAHEAGVGWEDVVQDWDDWLDVQVAALEAASELSAAGGCPKAAVAAILAALDDPDGQELWAVATRALAKLGDAGCTVLIELIDDASPLNRKRIAAALSASASPAAAGALARLGRDESAAVRIAAIRSAAVLGHTDICEAGLEDLLPEVRAQTIEALPVPSADQIAKALNDASDEVRIAACRIICGAGRKRQDLSLVSRAQRLLRTGSAFVLAALVDAIAVAEPAQAVDFIADVVNHSSTKPQVRCACIRVLAGLQPDNAVALLSTAAGDDRRDVRLAAVAALGKISQAAIGQAATGLADAAAAVLCAAISGELVEVPEGYQPERDNVIEFVQKKGGQVAGEEAGKGLKIDREGNVVEPVEAEATAESGEPEQPPAAPIAPPAPTSTLEAILAATPSEETPQPRIEFDDEDLAFLELTPSRAVKRKLDPEATAPAHLDVRRLAARVAGETCKPVFVSALAGAAGTNDDELSEACLVALGQISDAGADLTAVQDVIVQAAALPKASLRARAIAVLGNVRSKQAAAAIVCALEDAPGAVRANAVKAALDRDDITVDAGALIADDDRNVRLAAAEFVADRAGEDVMPVLLDFALREDAVHLDRAAQLLAPRLQHAVTSVLEWLKSDDRKKRLVALRLVPQMITAAGNQPAVS